MKKENVILILGIISLVVGTSTSVYAAGYLYTGGQISYDNTASKLTSTNVQEALNEVYAAALNYETLKAQVINAVYPKGAVYCSSASTSPNTLFVCSWTRIKDKFILAAGDTYSAGSTGGAAKVTLTVNEMPSHTHELHTNAQFTVANGQGTGASGIPAGNSGWGSIWNAHWYTLWNSSTGGGQAHENMPPYVTYYCWERTS